MRKNTTIIKDRRVGTIGRVVREDVITHVTGKGMAHAVIIEWVAPEGTRRDAVATEDVEVLAQW